MLRRNFFSIFGLPLIPTSWVGAQAVAQVVTPTLSATPALPVVVSLDGMKYFILNNMIFAKEDHFCKYWYDENSQYHRDDGPALEFTNGEKHWYQHGKKHRDNDLPAIERANGNKEWYLNDKLHRDNDQPAVEHANGTKEWFQNGQFHRDNDLPAVEYANGAKHFYQHGAFHYSLNTLGQRVV